VGERKCKGRVATFVCRHALNVKKSVAVCEWVSWPRAGTWMCVGSGRRGRGAEG
jgi:hypothetical protein